MAGSLLEVPEAGFGERSLAWLQRCDARAVLLILLFALGVRLVCMSRSDLIGTDSMRFLQAAQHVEEGRLWEAIQDPFHPELGFLTALLNKGQRWALGAPRDFGEYVRVGLPEITRVVPTVVGEYACQAVVLYLDQAIVAQRVGGARQRMFDYGHMSA